MDDDDDDDEELMTYDSNFGTESCSFAIVATAGENDDQPKVEKMATRTELEGAEQGKWLYICVDSNGTYLRSICSYKKTCEDWLHDKLF